jgi:hypothetical protein
MARIELIIQLLKIAIGIAFGAYFVWWSLQVLDRLTPEYEAPAAMIGRALAAWRASAGALAEDEEPERTRCEAGGGEGLGSTEVEVTNERPWRLADLTFLPAETGRERATLEGVEVVRENGRYWILTPDGPLWSNIDERGVDPALNYLFGKRQQEQSSR